MAFPMTCSSMAGQRINAWNADTHLKMAEIDTGSGFFNNITRSLNYDRSDLLLLLRLVATISVMP
jgi:hypothetical protein